jgi:hypothetical protein
MRDRETGPGDRSRGLTVLELLVLVAIVAGGVALGLFWASTHPRDGTPTGIIPYSIETAGRSLVVAGEIYGYEARDGRAGDIPVSFGPDPVPGIDALLIPVQLIVGQGSFDMGSLGVAVRSREGTAVLARDGSGRPGRSSWAVAGKAGVMPLQAADPDDILEEPETFWILVVPPRPLDPGGHVTVTLSPVPGIPLVIDRDIPARLSPVTLLSL